MFGKFEKDMLAIFLDDLSRKRHRPGPFGPGLSLSKKLACGDLFRQKLPVMFSAKLKTPRPTGKAGRYEYSQRGCGPSDNSPEGVFLQSESSVFSPLSVYARSAPMAFRNCLAMYMQPV